ncbi:hypothetical protein HF888_00855 [Bermanella marisrubri]|uniref:Uncharacterized protein n=1 Tax=Bermanella marisrubri TaxID=207949 RepID=Q1N458_9GAMM|nr:hypothetical protein [Bermanella marisrubri]EAT13007.1 hypothetical protein RED65_14962 [Oceanobacter sp. RED65] [Bermanella marisrubri]QIZ82866.1 hypothetical protein HF888_00855 [Bermanella marisrubri]
MNSYQCEYLDLLNRGLIGTEVGFQAIRARKDYIDYFGAKINTGEIYYARSLENNSLINTRVSQESIEKIIALLFTKSRAQLKLLESINVDEDEAFKRHQAGLKYLNKKAKAH